MAIMAAISTSSWNIVTDAAKGGPPIIKTLKSRGLRSFRNINGIERALFGFDLDADFSPCFHWNKHQVNAFVVAEYQTTKNVRNEIILWDSVIPNATVARIKLKDEFVKFGLIDQGTELRNQTISLRLWWDQMPITGAIYSEIEGEPAGGLDRRAAVQTPAAVLKAGGRKYLHSIKIPGKYKT